MEKTTLDWRIIALETSRKFTYMKYDAYLSVPSSDDTAGMSQYVLVVIVRCWI